MRLSRVCFFVCSYLTVGITAFAASLPCIQPGTERWPVKTSLPPGAPTKTMTLADALNLPRLTNVNATSCVRDRDRRPVLRRRPRVPARRRHGAWEARHGVENAMGTASGDVNGVCAQAAGAAPKPLTSA